MHGGALPDCLIAFIPAGAADGAEPGADVIGQTFVRAPLASRCRAQVAAASLLSNSMAVSSAETRRHSAAAIRRADRAGRASACWSAMAFVAISGADRSDEPTTARDVVSQVNVLRLLAEAAAFSIRRRCCSSPIIVGIAAHSATTCRAMRQRSNMDRPATVFCALGHALYLGAGPGDAGRVTQAAPLSRSSARCRCPAQWDRSPAAFSPTPRCPQRPQVLQS